MNHQLGQEWILIKIPASDSWLLTWRTSNFPLLPLLCYPKIDTMFAEWVSTLGPHGVHHRLQTNGTFEQRYQTLLESGNLHQVTITILHYIAFLKLQIIIKTSITPKIKFYFSNILIVRTQRSCSVEVWNRIRRNSFLSIYEITDHWSNI